MLHDKKMSPLQISKTGLIRMRTVAPMSRRTFSLGALTAGAAAVTGVGSASAGTGVKYHGWQGYDDATNAGSFLDNIDVVLEPTYINSNEEIIATARQRWNRSHGSVHAGQLYGPVVHEVELARTPGYGSDTEPSGGIPRVPGDPRISCGRRKVCGAVYLGLDPPHVERRGHHGAALPRGGTSSNRNTRAKRPRRKTSSG